MLGKRKVITKDKEFVKEIFKSTSKAYDEKDLNYNYDIYRNKLIINLKGIDILTMFITGEYEVTITKIVLPKDVKYQIVPIKIIQSLMSYSKEMTILDCSDERLMKFLEDDGFEIIHEYYEHDGLIRKVKSPRALYWNSFHDYDFYMIS